MRVALAILALAVGPAPASAACPAVQEGFRRLAMPQAEIAYRWEPARLKVGQFFSAVVVVCRTAERRPVRAVAVEATMPAHGHGMNYRPAATRTGPQSFRVTGLMLHMPGKWRMTFDLVQGDKRTRLTEEVSLKP
jgi:hypothetical protein